MNEEQATAAGKTGGSVRVTCDGAVATVTLSHPGRLNAITVAMWRELGERFRAFADDPHLRCVVVRGAEGNFAAGADITEFPEVRKDLESVIAYHEEILAPALRAVVECPIPTVTLIEGVCVGGGLEIACQCDLRIAAESARCGAPINQLGFPMAPEELRGLLAVAGRAVTLELLLEGRILSAREAHAKGLFTRVVANADLDREGADTAARIAAASPLAARINKQTIRRLTPLPAKPTAEEIREFYAQWCSSDDHREGVRAFLEKRTPRFDGTNELS